MPPSAFKIRDFRLLTQTRFLFSFSVQIQAVVIGWQVYEIMRDPLYLALIGLTEAVPALSLALFAGHVVDRGNPLRIYKNVLWTSLLSALILLTVSLPWFGVVPHSKLPWLYVAAFLTGTARGFSSPALFSIIPQLVPRESLRHSSAWITLAFQIGSVTGPALGGILYAWRGPVFPYAVDCLMLVAGLASVALVKFQPVKNEDLGLEPIRTRLTSGLNYVFGHQLLLAALALDMFAVLFGGVTALLPIFSGEILNSGPWGLGILRGSPAVGAILMSLVLMRYPVGRGAGKILLGVVAGFGFCMIGFAVSRELWLSALLLAVSGAFDSVSMVVRGAIVQLCSPPAMRGRIASVNSIFIGSSNELGAFESGMAAKAMGVVPSVIFGGSMTLITVIIAYWRAPRLREMDLSKL